MPKRKPPELGDYIQHSEPAFDRVNEGTVDSTTCYAVCICKSKVIEGIVCFSSNGKR